MTKEKTTFGFNLAKELAEQSVEDWKLGATGLTCLAQIPEEEREKYLPRGELQFGREDFMDCVSRAVNNVLETKFNWLLANKKLSLANEMWLKEKGYVVGDRIEFSDRFVAILSGTTREGNSFKSPLDSVRKNGLIPKAMLPAESWMGFDDYHNSAKISENMKALGLEFIQRFFINYERGPESDFENLLKNDMLMCGGYAWPTPVNGEYPRTNYSPNHAFMVFKRPRYFVFDNYLDSGIAGDWIKKLASSFDLLDMGYRIAVNQKEFIPIKKNFLQRLLGGLRDYFGEIFR